jgi:hypothetical protein
MGAAIRDEMREKLATKLSKLELPWQVGRIHAPGESPLRWIPVIDLKEARLRLGISSGAWWVVIGPGSITEFKPDVQPVFLLPILELPLEKVRRLIEEALQANSLPRELINIFPFEDVINTGLKSHSERWASLALERAKTWTFSSGLAAGLEALAKSGPTQKLRHGAQKVIADYRRAARS